MTATQLEVLRLIAQQKHLGDYVPRYRPGAKRGRGAFPVTIAARAARQLRGKGLVAVAPNQPSGHELTPEGQKVLDQRCTAQRGHGSSKPAASQG